MSAQINDGGPAFPADEVHDTHPAPGETACRHLHAHQGMSLRDYFAAKALQGFLANKSNPTRFNPEGDAEYVYRIADAMLAKRAKGGAA